MQQTGVRAYGSMDPRQLVSYGAAMALRANVGFQPVFTKLLRDMNGEIYDVANFQVQETGLEGYIQRDLVHLALISICSSWALHSPNLHRNMGYISPSIASWRDCLE